MKEYKLMDELTSVEIDKRFKHDAVKYYVRRLSAQVQEQPFTEKQPAKDLKEKYVRVKTAMSSWMTKTEKKLDDFATRLDSEVIKVVEASGVIIDEGAAEDDEEEEDKAIETRPVEPNGDGSLRGSEGEGKKDWRAKITGIFKSKKQGDSDIINVT